LDDIAMKSEELSAQSQMFMKRAKQQKQTLSSTLGQIGKSGFIGGSFATGMRAPSEHYDEFGRLQDKPQLPQARGALTSEVQQLITHISVSLRDDTACGSLLSDDSHNPQSSLPIQIAWRNESLPLKRTVILALPSDGKTKTSSDGTKLEKYCSTLQVFSHSSKTTSAPPTTAPNCTVLRDIRINTDHVPNAPAIRLVVEISRNGRVLVTANGKILPMHQSSEFGDVRGEFYFRGDDTSGEKNVDEETIVKIPRSLFGIELSGLPSTANEYWLRTNFFPTATAVEIQRCSSSGMAKGRGYVSFVDDDVTNGSEITSYFVNAESNHSPLERKGLTIEGVPRIVITAIQQALAAGFSLQKMLPCAAGAILRSYLADFHNIVASEMNKVNTVSLTSLTNPPKFLTYKILAEKVNLFHESAAVLLILLVALESLESLCPSQAYLARCAADQIVGQAPDNDKTAQIFRNEDVRRRARTLLCKSSELSDGVDVFVVAVREPVPLDDGERRLCDIENFLGVDRHSALPQDNFDYATFEKNNAVKVLPLW
jgi:hypothetical protein